MAIPSDEESDSELVIDEQEEEKSGSAWRRPAAQTSIANTSATPMEDDVQLAVEIQQQEQEVEVGETMEVSVATQEEFVTEVASTLRQPLTIPIQ